MKTSLLLIGFLLIIIETNAQIGLHTIYNPYLLSPKKKASALKNTSNLKSSILDSAFAKNQTLFLKYIPRRKYIKSVIFADNSFNVAGLNMNQGSNEIDLEKSKNRTKQLFFKMKMWRYFRE